MTSSRKNARSAGVTRRNARLSSNGYIVMNCLHYTTLREMKALAPRRPIPGEAWCPKCSKWCVVIHRVSGDPDNQEPLF